MNEENQNTDSHDEEIFDYLGLGDSEDNEPASRKKIIVVNAVAGVVACLVLLIFLWFVFVSDDKAPTSVFFLIVPLMVAVGIFLIVWQGNYRPGKKIPVADGLAAGFGLVLIVIGVYEGYVLEGMVAGVAVWGVRLVRKIIDPFLLRCIVYLKRTNEEIKTKKRRLNWLQKIFWYTGKSLVLAVVFVGKAVRFIFRLILEILRSA